MQNLKDSKLFWIIITSFFPLFFLLSLPFFLSGCLTGEEDIVAKYEQYEEGDYADLYVGDFIIHNNIWGKSGSMYYKQGVFTKKRSVDEEEQGGEIQAENSPLFGWRWRCPETDGYTVRGYPEVMYGPNPWYKTPNPYFPCRVTRPGITVEYDVTLKSWGEHNLAFDLWINSSVPSSTDNITHEIMIWQVNKGMTPGGQLKDRVEINGIRYGVYVWESVTLGQPEGDRTYIAFVAATNQLSGEVPIDQFLDYLIKNTRKIQTKNFFTDSLFLAGIEFGTEMVDGSGEIIFNKYRVKVQ